MGELLPVLFKCILKEILSLLSLDETVENLKFPFPFRSLYKTTLWFCFYVCYCLGPLQQGCTFSMKSNVNKLFTTARVIIVKVLWTTHLLGLVE